MTTVLKSLCLISIAFFGKLSGQQSTGFGNQSQTVEKIHANQAVKLSAKFVAARDAISKSLGRVNVSDGNQNLPERDKNQIVSEFPWIKNPASNVNVSEIIKDGRSRLGGPKDISKAVGLSQQNSFEVRRGYPTANGTYKVVMKQMWNGIGIYNSKIVAEQESTGFVLGDTINGRFLDNIELEIVNKTPRLDNETALSIAKRHNKDLTSNIENVDVQLQILSIKGQTHLAYIVDYFVPGSLYKYKPKSVENVSLKDLNLAQLQQMFSRMERSDAKRLFTIIDAQSGQIYRSWNGLTNALARTPLIIGNPESGILNVSQMVDKQANFCTYSFPLSRDTYITTNDRKDAAVRRSTQFDCPIAGDSAYDKTNEAQSPRNAAYKWAVDIHSYMKIISSYIYRKNIPIEVHHDGMTAMWTGSKMVFGDGNHIFYPMTEPDIIAHEMFHLFTDVQSNLEYRGQSGAIAEAYSDMAGVAFLNFKRGSDSFTIGNLVSKLRIPLRDLCNPSSNLVISYSQESPILDHASQWYENTTVHRGMGIYSKAFCLLAKSTHWNIQSAFKVFTDANMFSWTPETTFSTGACGVRQAAIDYRGFGAQSDVDTAFAAVGIVCSE